jgi:MFS family permease
MPNIVFLVHGTSFFPWSRGKGALWMSPGSAMWDALQKLPGPPIVRSFLWSGRNSMKARSDAAHDLASQLRAAAQGANNVTIIGHSHGGNVALQAVGEAHLEYAVKIICLSTPFILPRARVAFVRHYRLLNYYVVTSLMSLPLAGLFAVAGLRWRYFPFVLLLLSLLLGWLPLMGKPVQPAWHRRSFEKFQLHIFRAAGDEASMGLSVVGIASLITTQLYSLVQLFWFNMTAPGGRIHVREQRSTAGIDFAESRSAPSRDFVVLFVVILLMAALTGSVKPSLTVQFLLRACLVTLLCGALATFAMSMLQLVVLTSLSIVLALFGVTAILSTILLMPILGILFVAGRLFGSGDFLSNVYFDLSVEAAPPGEWKVTIVDRPVQEGFLSFAHSIVYDDPNILERISKIAIPEELGVPRA